MARMKRDVETNMAQTGKHFLPARIHGIMTGYVLLTLMVVGVCVGVRTSAASQKAVIVRICHRIFKGGVIGAITGLGVLSILGISGISRWPARLDSPRFLGARLEP